MKLAISTPMYGGMVFERYMSSLITCLSRGSAEGLFSAVSPHFQTSESLIHRARDRSAMFMLEGGFDKLITIDADVSFTYEDFKNVITSDQPIVGGVYPLKAFPVVLNFNPLPEKGTELFSSNRGIDYDKFQEFKKKYADPMTGLAEVRHLATGFLCVKREVFEKLGETSEVYDTFDSSRGERKRFMHFYTSGVHEGQLESEDWSFCRRAREAGFPIHFDTRVILGHTGNHEFRVGQFFGQAGQ